MQKPKRTLKCRFAVLMAVLQVITMFALPVRANNSNPGITVPDGVEPTSLSPGETVTLSNWVGSDSNEAYLRTTVTEKSIYKLNVLAYATSGVTPGPGMDLNIDINPAGGAVSLISGSGGFDMSRNIIEHSLYMLLDAGSYDFQAVIPTTGLDAQKPVTASFTKLGTTWSAANVDETRSKASLSDGQSVYVSPQLQVGDERIWANPDMYQITSGQDQLVQEFTNWLIKDADQLEIGDTVTVTYDITFNGETKSGTYTLTITEASGPDGPGVTVPDGVEPTPVPVDGNVTLGTWMGNDNNETYLRTTVTEKSIYKLNVSAYAASGVTPGPGMDLNIDINPAGGAVNLFSGSGGFDMSRNIIERSLYMLLDAGSYNFQAVIPTTGLDAEKPVTASFTKLGTTWSAANVAETRSKASLSGGQSVYVSPQLQVGEERIWASPDMYQITSGQDQLVQEYGNWLIKDADQLEIGDTVTVAYDITFNGETKSGTYTLTITEDSGPDGITPVVGHVYLEPQGPDGPGKNFKTDSFSHGADVNTGVYFHVYNADGSYELLDETKQVDIVYIFTDDSGSEVEDTKQEVVQIARSTQGLWIITPQGETSGKFKVTYNGVVSYISYQTTAAGPGRDPDANTPQPTLPANVTPTVISLGATTDIHQTFVPLDNDPDWKAAYVQFTPDEDGSYRFIAWATVAENIDPRRMRVCAPNRETVNANGSEMSDKGWNCMTMFTLEKGVDYVIRILVPSSADLTQSVNVEVANLDPPPNYPIPREKWTNDETQIIHVTAPSMDITQRLADVDEHWEAAYIRTTPAEDGIYRLMVSLPEGFAATSMKDGPMFPNISCTLGWDIRSSGGHRVPSQSKDIDIWEFYRLEKGKTYDFMALVCKHGIDYSKYGVTLEFEKVDCPLRPDEVYTMQGHTVVAVKGFYNPADRVSSVVSANQKVVIDATDADAQDVSAASVSLEVASTSTLAENNVQSATIKTDVADVSFDSTAISKIAAPQESVTLNVSKQNAPDSLTVTLDMNAGMGAPVLPEATSAQNGLVTVSVPYPDLQDGNTVVVDYVKPDGISEPVAATYDSEAQAVTFTTTHFSDYRITEKQDPCHGQHTFGAYVSNNDATCEQAGTETAVCTVCKTVTTTRTTEKLNHRFTNYVSDKNASCRANGTKTAVCDLCGTAKDTQSDPGSKLEHNYQNGICTVCGAVSFKTDCDGQTGCATKDYTDVVKNNWYHTEGYVDYVVARGIMTGTSTNPLLFAPEAVVTRAQMVETLWKMDGKPAVQNTAPFTDLPQAWYQSSISWAYENGIAQGIGNHQFNPEGTLTREEMVTFLYRYAKFKGVDVSIAKIPKRFSDSGSVSEFAVPAMAWAIDSGIISGMGTTPETIAPQGLSKRSQLAKVLTVYLRMSE